MSVPLPRPRYLILAVLVVLTAAAWAVLLGFPFALPLPQPADMSSTMGMPNQPPMSLTMGLDAPLFLAIWVIMMVAMMFPSAAPMIVMFARIHAGKRPGGHPFGPTWVFVAAYFLIWTLFGVGAYLGAVGVEAIGHDAPLLIDNAARLGGGLLIVAGLYQLSPLKQICLTKCRTPLGFLLGSWRDGYGGAFRMGLDHGLYCLGCCWLLFVILFPLGIMNVAAMAGLTLLIFAEKSLPVGRQVSRLAALALIGYGALAVFVPGVLPTMV